MINEDKSANVEVFQTALSSAPAEGKPEVDNAKVPVIGAAIE